MTFCYHQYWKVKNELFQKQLSRGAPQKIDDIQNAFLEKIFIPQLYLRKLTTGAEKLFCKTPPDDCLSTDEKIKSFKKVGAITGNQHILRYC